jgi:hypothetical protein
MVSDGVVTGGDYADVNTGKSCQPYLFAPCMHHAHSAIATASLAGDVISATSERSKASYPRCPTSEYNMSGVGSPSSCTDNAYSRAYATDKAKAEKVVEVFNVAGLLRNIETVNATLPIGTTAQK